MVSRAGRGPAPASLQAPPSALRGIFTDLMAYALFFETTCAQQSPPLKEVRDKITGLIKAQEERVKAGEVPSESYSEARFAVLSWVDELILNSAWPLRGQWNHLMLTYYGTLNAGEQFFQRLEKLPPEAKDVREIYYLCLSLGFLGKYAVGEDPKQLKELRRGLYRQLSGYPNDIRQSYHRLFPEAYPKASGGNQPALSRVNPLWVGLALLVPALLFVSYWILLRREATTLLAVIEKQPVIAKPVEMDWIRSLIEELRRSGFEARETPRGVLITLFDLLFEMNSADLSRGEERKIAEIVSVVNRHAPGRMVRVEGHASRERGGSEQINRRLSEDRAHSVAEAFMAHGLRSGRVMAKGFGSSQPVTSNDSEEGRRQNRRVEIIVEK